MAHLRTHQALAALLGVAVISGCGGGTSPPPLPSGITVAPASPAAPSLMVSPTSQALAVSGRPRHFLVTNVGGLDALNLLVTAGTALPTGSGFTTDCAATLAPGASCTLTVTPGADPSAAPGDTAPQPAELRIAGSNTNTLALPFQVLDFGSVYQGGYVFDIDDGTPGSAGVGGKVLALDNASATMVRWLNMAIVSTPLSLGNTDGAANTATIVQMYGTPPSSAPEHQYAAWACSNSTEAGYVDWYLPAICEMGYDRDNRGSGCGTSDAPLLPNIQSHLADRGVTVGLQTFQYASSSTASTSEAWVQHFFTTFPDSAQHPDALRGDGLARCVRALTP